MAYFRCGGGGIPSSLKSGMNDVLNKKFGTSTTYAPATWPDNVNLLGPLPIKTASGSIASFSDGADDVPIKSATFGIVASGGNGTPSSPVPIVGVSSVTVKQRGKNLLNPTLYDGGAYNPTVDSQRTFTESETQFTHVGNTYSVSFTESWKNYTMLIPVKYGQAYYCNFTLSGTGTNLGTSVYYVDADNKVMSSASNNTTNPQTRAFSVNVPSGAKYFCITFTNRGTAETTLTFTEPQIEVGSSSTTYEAYKSKTPITVSLGQTVYGGTLAEDGTLTVTWKQEIITFDGSENWKVHGTIPSWFYLDGVMLDGYKNDSEDDYIVCNRATQRKYSQVNSISNGQCALGGTGFNRFVFMNTDYSDVDDFKTWLSSNNVSISYKLATPIVITGLDEISISTYLGDNNIWCDTGDSEVTYRADINLALNQ